MYLCVLLFLVYCSEGLPLNVVETEGVEEFLQNAALTKLTAVPQGPGCPLCVERIPVYYIYHGCGSGSVSKVGLDPDLSSVADRYKF